MTNLTYKVTYNPMKDTHESALNTVNFLCSDNKLHIRLRDYDHEETITGFINKLTYLITYLIQGQVIGSKSVDEVINLFTKEDSDFTSLNTWLGNAFMVKGYKWSGIKVYKNYRKVRDAEYNLLGSFAEGTCPLKDGTRWATLNEFEYMLGYFNLIEFLFNDAVEIEIKQAGATAGKSYTKFTNKAKRKKFKKELEYVPLF